MNGTLDKIKVQFDYLPLINFAMQQNKVSVIHRLSIENMTSEPFRDIQVLITAEPDFGNITPVAVEAIPANDSVCLQSFSLVLSANYFAQLTERMSGSLKIEIRSEAELIFTQTYPIDILAYDQWGGINIFPEMLAAFITPNHAVLAPVIKRAAAILEQWTGTPSLDEYQSRNPDRVRKQMAAIYTALTEQQIIYSTVPASFEEHGQRVRLTDSILSQKLGTCLDMALLYASCLESIGLNALIVITKGHAFAGGWLVPETFPDATIDDVSLLTKRTAEGIYDITLVETTCMSMGYNTGFDNAVKSADGKLSDSGNFILAIDVRRARHSGIRPIPQRVLNGQIWEIKEEKERVILVGVSTRENDDTEDSLDELKDLVKTAGAEAVGRVIQKRELVHPGTYVGKGKIEEIRELLWELDATGIVCDDELSPAQMNNLTDILDVKVMDRTMVILDIFAGRASTSEGKIQVELAQLKYRQSQLTGAGRAMSRLGGGIGTRGPGEKKLEMDRRLIKNRIAQLNRELREVKRHRELTREQRTKNRIPVVAIVGYTNAGKSTLLNTLTGAGVLQEDQLFATLDPTTRSRKLPSGQEILLTDTVGFIRKLPHHLIDAFKSTLEEAKYADLILHVVDASNPQMDEQMYVVYETLQRLEAMDKPVVTAFNKMDRIGESLTVRDFKADRIVQVSAKTGEGLEALLQAIEEILREQKIYIERVYSYQESGKIQLIRKYGELLEEEYKEDGIHVSAYVPKELDGRV